MNDKLRSDVFRHVVRGTALLVALACLPSAYAETGTVNVDGVPVAFLKFPPARGVGLTREEALDLVRKSKPADLIDPLTPTTTAPLKRP